VTLVGLSEADATWQARFMELDLARLTAKSIRPALLCSVGLFMRAADEHAGSMPDPRGRGRPETNKNQQKLVFVSFCQTFRSID
jgi:hypothetical protein